MSGQILAPPRVAASWSGQKAIPALIVGLLGLGLMFHTEVSAAIRVWIESTAYNHCFLVIPIAAYLVWDRRAALAGAVPRPMPMAALAALPISAAWFLADRVGIMEGRQLMAMCLVQLLFLTVLGWRLYRALLGPLLYLFFLVPFGAFITPFLQDITTAFTTRGLDLFGVPYYADAYSIEIPEGSFYIAEACAGLRFLIAAIAFGCLYALLMYRSPLRRALFILVSIIVPVIANGFRALGIILLGHALGSAQAVATDHVLYGWIFFSLVIFLLVLLGLPFRQDDSAPVAPVHEPDDQVPSRRRLFGAAAAALAASVIGPALAAAFDVASAAALPPAPKPLATEACSETAPVDQFASGSSSWVIIQHVTCAGGPVVVRLELFSPRSDPGVLVSEQRRLLGLQGDLSASRTIAIHGIKWRVIETEAGPHTGASTLWMAGWQGSAGFRARALQGWASILGGAPAPVAMAIVPDPDPTSEPGGARRAEKAIVSYLESQPELASTIARISGTASHTKGTNPE
jgi:exosortase A